MGLPLGVRLRPPLLLFLPCAFENPTMDTAAFRGSWRGMSGEFEQPRAAESSRGVVDSFMPGFLPKVAHDTRPFEIDLAMFDSLTVACCTEPEPFT